jgi:hypothetical protein
MTEKLHLFSYRIGPYKGSILVPVTKMSLEELNDMIGKDITNKYGISAKEVKDLRGRTLALDLDSYDAVR